MWSSLKASQELAAGRDPFHFGSGQQTAPDWGQGRLYLGASISLRLNDLSRVQAGPRSVQAPHGERGFLT